MTHCAKCHRPLRLPSHDGLGPVCRRKRAAQGSAVDLFTPRLDAHEAAARIVVSEVIEAAALRARIAVRHWYLVALERMGL